MTDTNNATTENPGQGQPQTGAEQQTQQQPPANNPLNAFAQGQQPTDNPLNNAAGQPQGQQEQTDPLAWLPEKFRSKAADGTTVDYEASARKLAESYSHLEKRNGAGELAPADISGYKLVGDGMPSLDDLRKHPDFEDFLGRAHAAGVNNQQLSLMVGEIANQVRMNSPEPTGMTAEACEAELRKEWTTPDAYGENMAAAVAAVRAVFKSPQEQQAVLNAYGTDPKIIRLMATLGREVGEDRMTFIGQPATTDADIDSLMRHPGYRDANHAEHKAIRAKVSAHFQRVAGSQPVV